MVYITGDMHGDLSRLKRRAFHKAGLHYPKKGDTLIVCGDFGFVWDHSKQEQKLLKKLGKKPFRILFIRGTHENFALLEDYPVKDFAGGKARQISGRLHCLENGCFFRLGGKTFFTFGGGESPDKLIRMETDTYDAREMPSTEEIQAGRQAYFQKEPVKGRRADFIITHDAPTRMRNFINLDNGEMNELHALFDEISEDDAFEKWYFGRYHMDRALSKKFFVVYRNILVAVPRKKKKKKAAKQSAKGTAAQNTADQSKENTTKEN